MADIIQSGSVTTHNLNIPVGWESWKLLISDVHWDSQTCYRDKLVEHLELAVQRKAGIQVFGDFFDAMQGRYDPRRSARALREEYQNRDDYYDAVVRDASKFLTPYSHNIELLSDGNHETGVLKNANTSLLNNLAYDLNISTSSRILRGGYGGWVRYMFNLSDGKNTGARQSVRVKYYHGSGGEAPVTRGVIQTNRQAVYLPDANVIINGHSHNAYYVPITRERLSNKGVQYFDIQHHVRIPGYHMAYGDGTAGWEVERGGVPKPVGGWWMRLYFESRNAGVKVQFLPAFDDPIVYSSIPMGVNERPPSAFDDDGTDY